MGPWGARYRGRRFPCAIGRGGICAADDKREGDGATPAGAWRIVEIRVRPDRLPACGATPLRRHDGWSEDPADPAYNRPIRHPHTHGAERMFRADRLYDRVAITDHNQPPVPDLGSAIFLHHWRRPRFPTAGCVAFRPDDLAWILARWSPLGRVVIRPRGGL